MRVVYIVAAGSAALVALSSSGRAEPQMSFCGAHRAEIAGTAGPEGRGRVSILAPALGVTAPLWAERALPAKGATPRRALAGDDAAAAEFVDLPEAIRRVTWDETKRAIEAAAKLRDIALGRP